MKRKGSSCFEWEKACQFVVGISLSLLLTGIRYVSAHTVVQEKRISLEIVDGTFYDLITEIEKQSEFMFFYNSDEIDNSRKINIKVQDKRVDQILTEVMKDNNLTYRISGKHILITQKNIAYTEQTTAISHTKVSGVISDDNSRPMEGVSVVEKNTTNGTTTDKNGVFSLSVPNGGTLQVSCVGYATQTIEITQPHLHINLKADALALDELLVIGYGTAKKADVTGAVVRADLSTLQESPNINLASALQGTVAGLNVGAVTTAGSDPQISIRGTNTISGTTSPLIVLDGIIFRRNIVDININDVESVDILKDASAAAIYGSQASNGVILITTKSAKISGKPVLEYNGYYSFQNLSTDQMKPMNSAGYLQFVADRFLRESRSGDDLSKPNPDWDVTNYLVDGNAVNGYLNGTDTDWWSIFTNERPYIHSQDISARGRSDLSSYYVSMGYTRQDNVVINDVFRRYNLRINLDTKITDWLRVGTQSFFTSGDYSGVSPTLANVIHLPSLVPLKDDQGEYMTYPYLSIYNPLKEIESDNLQQRISLMGNFFLESNIPFINGLNYRLNFSQNLVSTKTFNFRRKDEQELANGSKVNSSQYDWTADHILTYKNNFGRHDVHATFVYGAEKRQFERTGASGTNYTNTILGYNFLQGANANQQYISSDAWQETSLYTMLRAGYNFNDRYMFTGTVRRDGFSGFGKANKFGVFPSAAVAWRLSDERFMREQMNWIEDLKLRLSYGMNGNRTVSRYQTLARAQFTDAYLYGDGAAAEKGVTISSMANPDLKWETTNTLNTGVDFNLFNNRVYGAFEYYTSNTFDLLYAVSLPNYNMVWSNIGNMGKLSNRGIELTIGGVPVEKTNFRWNVTLNYSLNRNKVWSITGVDADGDGKEDDMIANSIFIGKPYGVIYDFRQIGMWQMEDYLAGRIPEGFTYGTYKIADLDGDGNITTANDREILGYTDPSYRFSIQNTLRYKTWELKFFINSIQGGKDYYYGRPGAALANPDYIYQYNSFDFDYWTPENPNARYRQIGVYPTVLGSHYSPLVQRNFIRLQDISLSYTVSSKWLDKWKIGQLKVFLTGKNLITLTDWDGWDPEVGTGLVETAYPLMKSYTFGANFSL